MNNIKYPIAFDSKGSIVRADDPDIQIRRSSKTCCGCGRPMHYVDRFARYDGTIVSQHFRHNQDNPNCTVDNATIAGESIYHSDFKDLLYNEIKRHIDNKVPLLIESMCECGRSHSHNIIERAFRVEKEYSDIGFRPDISLITADNKTFAVLEIVATHRPEPDYLYFLRNNNIHLLTFELSIDEPFQYWVNRYIRDDGVLQPSSISFIDFYCETLQQKYAFLFWTQMLESVDNANKVGTLECGCKLHPDGSTDRCVHHQRLLHIVLEYAKECQERSQKMTQAQEPICQNHLPSAILEMMTLELAREEIKKFAEESLRLARNILEERAMEIRAKNLIDEGVLRIRVQNLVREEEENIIKDFLHNNSRKLNTYDVNRLYKKGNVKGAIDKINELLKSRQSGSIEEEILIREKDIIQTRINEEILEEEKMIETQINEEILAKEKRIEEEIFREEIQYLESRLITRGLVL